MADTDLRTLALVPKQTSRIQRLSTRAAWYVTRLAAMNLPEIAHRFAELTHKILGYRYSKGWEDIPTSGDLLPLTNLSRSWDKIPDELKAITLREAAKIRTGRFKTLGTEWRHQFSMPPAADCWHLDSEGKPWPNQRAYCFNVPVRIGDGREVKHIWELNRLQFLVPLAVDARLRNDSVAKDLVIGIVASWMKGNPPYRGINWVSGIELSLRATSVAIALSIIGLEDVDDAERKQLSRFFSAHAFWLARFPSLFSSANNHRVAELVGLLVCWSCSSDGNNATLLARTQAQLIEEIQRQILIDGVGAEQSPPYSAFTVELLLLALSLSGVPADKLPDAARNRLSSWAEHIRWMMDSTGRVPAIGDCDQGKVIALTQDEEPTYPASILSALSHYLDKPDLAPPQVADHHLRDIVLGSTRTASPSPAGRRTWEHGGYTIMRSRANSPIVLTFDHGPLGYLSIAAHGHADALAIWLSIDSDQVLVDAGTYVYNSDSDWRNKFRSTLLHNTLSIGNVSSSQTAGPFNWAQKANTSLVSPASGVSAEVVAEHDGYRDNFGVMHRRKVSQLSETSFLIEDVLLGHSVDLPVNVSFLIGSQFRARPDSATSKSVLISKGDQDVLRLTGDSNLSFEIVRGDEASGMGWISPSFGIRTPADQVRFLHKHDEVSQIRVDILV